MTYIDIAAAQRFTAVIRAIHVTGPALTDEYRQGAAEAVGMMDVYLEELLADPDSDRQVAA